MHIAKDEIETKLETLVTKDQLTESTSVHSAAIRSVHETLESFDKRIDTRISSLDGKLASLDRKFDQMHTCSERNSQSINMVSLITYCPSVTTDFLSFLGEQSIISIASSSRGDGDSLAASTGLSRNSTASRSGSSECGISGNQ